MNQIKIINIHQDNKEKIILIQIENYLNSIILIKNLKGVILKLKTKAKLMYKNMSKQSMK